tara:strand:+ start:1907 stop:2107 length:201 start_codon:yes stop_codon:yes gene_type:complete
MGTSKKFIRLPVVIQLTGYRRSAIYEKMAAGTFPQPVKLGPRAIAWLSSEVESWMDERIAERDMPK